VRWGRQSGADFFLNETDEYKGMHGLLLQHLIEEAGSLSDRKIDANQKSALSDHDKNVFIEQHKDGYAILRGGMKGASGRRADAGCGLLRRLEN
jgi:hypothetical protein